MDGKKNGGQGVKEILNVLGQHRSVLWYFGCLSLGIWSAALNGDLGRVKYLIQKAVDPSQPDLAGYTALHYASRNGHYAVCQFLLESGAKCDAQTRGGATALHRASYCGHTEIARLLLSHGSNPRLVDDDGMTSLHKSWNGLWVVRLEKHCRNLVWRSEPLDRAATCPMEVEGNISKGVHWHPGNSHQSWRLPRFPSLLCAVPLGHLLCRSAQSLPVVSWRNGSLYMWAYISVAHGGVSSVSPDTTAILDLTFFFKKINYLQTLVLFVVVKKNYLKCISQLFTTYHCLK
ncbi:PREDICTED: ankyrin repeat domain-containing protein 39 isoform X1 [Myotis brandtii]|uniref:ankyrin repeat domain-containing protein 39 isoform X1 n=1 Tax=Myotis brandtii TaxID=109478 RepID=UPI000703D1F2|nr:PREDICTED: ankyrin repeat domain-containing protein 39 isoform X1 [Myotis brandtii]